MPSESLSKEGLVTDGKTISTYTAIVTIDVNGKTVNGEWVPGKPIEISVPGHYDPVSDGTVIYKRNSAGDEAQVHGYFYTKIQPQSSK